MPPLPSVVDRCPALDVTFSGADGHIWHARGDEGREAVALVESREAQVTWLNRRPRRGAWLVARGDRSAFVKRVSLRDLGAVLRATLRVGNSWMAYKGALHEAERTLAAESRVGRVARLYAMGERRRRGWVVEETLVFEALVEHETLLERIEALRGDSGARRAALERAMRVLIDYDRARLCHLDLNPRNLMLHESDPRQDCAVDIEQVVDLDRPRSDLLAHGFGYLYTQGMQDLVGVDEYNASALPALAEALGTSVDRIPEDVLRAYDWFLGRSLKRRQRLRLARVGLERLGWMRERIAHRARFLPLPSVRS